MGRFPVVILFLALLGAPAQAEEPPFEPTADEVLILHLVNRARANPPAEGDRIVAYVKTLGEEWLKDIDWKMFQDEMHKIRAAPPLVLNANLILAARGHAHYMAQNKSDEHEQVPGRPGFTGVRAGQRAKAAKYDGTWTGENIGPVSATGYQDLLEYIVDWAGSRNGGPGGMQAGRGHRGNIFELGATEFGYGLVRVGDSTQSVQMFGARASPRFAGGVAFVDRNGNRTFDRDEGLGEVSVQQVGGARTTTWTSGGYVLPLQGTSAFDLVAEWKGLRVTRRFDSTVKNLVFDAEFPPIELVTAVDAHLVTLEAARAAQADQAVLHAGLALLVATRGRMLDDDHATRVAAATKDAAATLDEAQEAVRATLTHDKRNPRGAVAKLARPFAGTVMADWFQDAVDVATPSYRARKFVSTKAQGRVPSKVGVSRALKQLRQVAPKLRVKEWKAHVKDLIAALKAL